MKKLYFTLSLFAAFAFSQTKEQVAEIIKDYDLKLIKEKRAEYFQIEKTKKDKALVLAGLNGWQPTFTDKDGVYHDLIDVSETGQPIYQITHNAAAARSTRAKWLNTGGGMGLTLNGENMTARVWDGGSVRRTHNSFSNRVTTVDDVGGTTYIQHATHVCGTIMASDLLATTKGMAWKASARTFNWTQDEAEALDETQLGMLLSNHSYGVPSTSPSGWVVGAYTDETRQWDEIAYLAPYYLAVMSAGNNGLDNNANAMVSGFDKLVGNKNGKNNLVIANAQDANIDANGNLVDVLINSSSSQGPSDDLRIKPDITGNGTALLSTSSASNTATASLTGTSMAAPNITGTLTLIQQHYNNLNNKFLYAATLKALACGTADDAGNGGPDPIFGWGLLNAKKAVETINGNGLDSWISEEKLNDSQTYVLNVKSSGTAPLVATVSWTDVPGPVNPGDLGINYSRPTLVNDIDVRIKKVSNNVVSLPWKLNPNDPTYAVQDADNNVDTVEQVQIDSPGVADYKIIITHKGTLVGGFQKFGLVVTGTQSNFTILSKSGDLTKCNNQTAVFDFEYKQTGTGTTNFTAAGLPNGATSIFSSSAMSANGNFTLTLSNLSNVTPGEYTIAVTGNNGSETETRYKTIKIYSSTFQNVNYVSPVNQKNGVGTSTVLRWNKQFNALSYDVQVATDVNFTNLIVNTTTTDNQYPLTNLTSDGNYYWRISAINDCGMADRNTQAKFVFNTGTLNCTIPVFTATNFSNSTIANTANGLATVPVTVSGGYTLADMNVILKLNHTYIQDIKVYLVGPTSIGSPQILMLNQPCGDNDNIDATIDDNGLSPNCSAAVPSLTGDVLSFEPLSDLNGLAADGEWTLKVVDAFSGDGGAVTSVQLKICGVAPSALSADSQILNQISVYPNPTMGLLNLNLNDLDNVKIALFDIQGREILNQKQIETIGAIDISGLQNGVYILTLEKDNSKQTRKIILNK